MPLRKELASWRRGRAARSWGGVSDTISLRSEQSVTAWLRRDRLLTAFTCLASLQATPATSWGVCGAQARDAAGTGQVVACTRSWCEGCVQTRGGHTRSAATRRSMRAHPLPHNRRAAVRIKFCMHAWSDEPPS